jgi:hypothetical protein
VVLVEGNGRLVDGVRYDEAGRDGLRRALDASQRLSQERTAESLPVKGTVEREPGEQHRRDLAGAASPQRAEQRLPSQEMSGERLMRENRPIAVMPDEGPSRAPHLLRASVLDEPLV